MKIWRIQVNASRTQYEERSYHLIHAATSREAIRKAIAAAKKLGEYKSYDVTSLELVGDAL